MSFHVPSFIPTITLKTGQNSDGSVGLPFIIKIQILRMNFQLPVTRAVYLKELIVGIFLKVSIDSILKEVYFDITNNTYEMT